MQIDERMLTFGERRAMRRLLRAKPGQITVRQVREFFAPTGAAFVVQIVGMMVLALCAGLVFLPFLLVVPIIPVWMPLHQRAHRRRWAKLMPAERDDEVVALA